jgi:hypothetical protein
MTNRLQAGIDFSQKKADFCLLFPDGQPLESHVSYANSITGYASAKRLFLEALDTYDFDGVDISGEATIPCDLWTRQQTRSAAGGQHSAH